MRKGAQKALMALAHHLITVAYNVLERGEEYVELGGDYYDQRSKPKALSRMVARLMKLGYQVTLTPVEQEQPSVLDPVGALTAFVVNADTVIPPNNPVKFRGSEVDRANAPSVELFVSTGQVSDPTY